jgi:hypothetical protein
MNRNIMRPPYDFIRQRTSEKAAKKARARAPEDDLRYVLATREAQYLAGSGTGTA